MGFEAKAHYKESYFLLCIYTEVKERLLIPYLLVSVSSIILGGGPSSCGSYVACDFQKKSYSIV